MMDWGEKNDGGDDDLELSLGLPLKNTSQKSSLPFPFNLPTKQPLPSQPPSASKPNNVLAINVNQLPVGLDTKLPPPPPPPPPSTVSSPDSTISSESRRKSEREKPESERYYASTKGEDDENPHTRKKLRLSKEQVTVLEDTFKHQSTLNLNQKASLARQLNLQTRQVEVWFQNRRARTKTKKMEIDREFLRRQCANLAEKNRGLQKEVAELRVLNLTQQSYMQIKPPTTLTLCPQCELLKSSHVTSSTPPVATGTGGKWLINRIKETSKDRINKALILE